MRNKISFHLAVISAYHANRPAELNAAATRSLVSRLQASKLAFKPVQGVWKGHAEESFVVFISSWRDGEDFKREYRAVMDAAAEFGQQSVLIISPEHTAFEHDQFGGETYLGLAEFARELPNPPPASYTRFIDGEYLYVVEQAETGARAEPTPVAELNKLAA
jgi:hypothetical protein